MGLTGLGNLYSNEESHHRAIACGYTDFWELGVK
jgi:hypothetical protein